MPKYISEFIGTFALVFAGTGAIIINDLYGGAVTHVGISLVFGLVVMVMIYAVGDVSMAQFNPAVTIGFWVAKVLPSREVIPFILSQLAGAFSASVLLWLIFPTHPNLGATLPAIGTLPTFIFETILTFFLMFVIINVAVGANAQVGLLAGVAIGGTVAFEALLAGPITGASMNPARSVAPAIVSGNINDLWIYVAAPITGAILAIGAYRAIRP